MSLIAHTRRRKAYICCCSDAGNSSRRLCEERYMPSLRQRGDPAAMSLVPILPERKTLAHYIRSILIIRRGPRPAGLPQIRRLPAGRTTERCYIRDRRESNGEKILAFRPRHDHDGNSETRTSP